MPGRSYGFIKDEIQPQDYIFSDENIAAEILEPEGDWRPYTPTPEYQNANGFDPYACATFNTLNPVEILLRRVVGEIDNFSDRYTAKVTGTEYQHGNSPQTVAEYIRKTGAVHEDDSPYTTDINTWEKFYAEPPSRLTDIAKLFNSSWDFKHDYVPTNPASMLEALLISPACGP